MPSMAYISLSKWRLRPSTPHSCRAILRLFCSTETPNPQIAPESDPNNGSAAETAPPAQTSKPRIRSPEKPEDIICRMMDSRAWTTRLQNSIRDLVPEFDHNLVWNVLHGAKPSAQFFRWVERSRLVRTTQFLSIHGQTGKAEVLFRQLMKKGVQDSVAFNNLIRGHAKEGNSDSAFEILNIMGRRGVPREADSYGLLIDAKTTLDNMIENGHVPESSLFRSVMESLFEDDRVQTASRVMKSMVEKGVNENMDLVAKVLEALFMRGHVEEALGRIDLLMHSGCAPEFDSLLSLLAEKKKTIAAVKLLDFCLERDCIVDFSSYKKVLNALLAPGKTLNAYSILCKIVAKGGDTDWHSTKDMIKSLNLEGNTKQADVLSRMIKGGEEKASQRNKGKKQVGLHSKNVLTDRPIRTFCSIPVVNGYDDASSANPKEVDRVCKVIQELFTLDRSMEAVLDDCGVELSHDLVVAILKRFSHARKPAFRFFCWAGERPGFEHDSTTYNSMMSILGKTRQFETMVSLLEEMGAKGTLTMETFVIAFRAFAAAKERKKAVGMFDLMKYYNFKYGVDTVNCLFDALGRAKLGKEMQLLFEKLKGRFTPNLQTYTVLLNGWCRVKNLMEAGQVWNEMIDKGFMPDVVTYNIMLEGLLRSHKRSDAIKLFELMKAKGPSPNVRSYSILIQNFCKQKQMKEAIDYLDEMRKAGCQPDVVVYTSLITGFGNQNKMNMVHGLLKAMKLDGCTPDEVTYNSLIKLMTRQRMPDDAAEIYKKMIQNGVEPSIHTYVMIMKSYFQMGNYTMGRAVWDEMIQKGCCPDDNSYTVLIGGLISQGRAGEACKFLDEMIEKGMKIPQLDFNKFAADFSRAGKPNLLEEMAQKMKFAGKFELSNVFAKWAEMTKIKVKGRDTNKTSGQGVYVTSHGSIHDNRS